MVEAAASEAPKVVALVQEMEAPLSLAFNRARLMILPEGVTKATGLREALAVLRLSAHNTVGIGDAEDDRSLLHHCEVGLAVAWGSARLKSVADGVIEGSGPAAVAAHLLQLARQVRLSPNLTGRRRVLLGRRRDGQSVMFPVLGRNLLIAGRAGSGKSWVAGLFLEGLILQRYCVCIIDPEGDYRTLEALPGVLLLGGDGRPPRVGDVLNALRHPDASVILELAGVAHAEKIDYLKNLLPALAEVRRRTGLPHRIVLDEAHYFLGHPDVDTAIDLEMAGYVLVTYRASQLRPEVLAAMETVVFTRGSPAEIRAVSEGFGQPAEAEAWGAILGDLDLGDAAAVSRQAGRWGQMTQVRLAPRLTAHVCNRNKYFHVEMDEGRPFVFKGDEGRVIARSHSLRDLCFTLAWVNSGSVHGHLVRRDFSSWVREVFRDDVLTASIDEAEAKYLPGQAAAVINEIVRAINARYNERGAGVTETSNDGGMRPIPEPGRHDPNFEVGVALT